MFSWSAFIYQFILLVIIILFFFSFYKFIRGTIRRNKQTNETLKRLEQKIDTLIGQTDQDR